ncbi:MAG: 2-oxoglutarate ferredoxin oxidoreductase subunit gamma [Clostridia bacterium]|jgi:2-oxoglutarate ferredoxin oxidoreductase subunit gamma|nr:2-oxoglutarate ferredoxin oxidoreductase subunit gamma [Clostridia bacterium]
MMHQFLLAGFGGQGVMLMGKILAYAGMKENKQVMYIPSYGSEMRGGTANCSVILSKEEIDAPVVSRPTGLVAMNTPSLDKFESCVSENGLIILNSSLIVREPVREDINIIKVPASDIAKELGNERIVNMVLLGALISVTNCLKVESVMESLKEILPPHRHDLLPLNQKAIEKAMNYIK